MRRRNRQPLEEELLDMLGPEAFFAFVEAFGGIRLYIAKGSESQIEKLLGVETAKKLAFRFGGEYFRVPLARTFRAKQYRAAGLSNPQIARKLGITDIGVDKLFQRTPTPRPPRQPRVDPRQIRLFE